jgi:hypothetical protein
MPQRMHVLALAVGAAFVVLGLWQMATEPEAEPDTPPASQVTDSPEA